MIMKLILYHELIIKQCRFLLVFSRLSLSLSFSHKIYHIYHMFIQFKVRILKSNGEEGACFIAKESRFSTTTVRKIIYQRFDASY